MKRGEEEQVNDGGVSEMKKGKKKYLSAKTGSSNNIMENMEGKGDMSGWVILHEGIGRRAYTDG